ncbi:inorganic phosphate transporter, partial [Pseudoflavonifractor capillosus]|nr:inorganic phosphate transporter [Pseudoflavonifractor capillosus]
GRRADWGVARSTALAWLCTFPGCMGLGWLLAKGMMQI